MRIPFPVIRIALLVLPSILVLNTPIALAQATCQCTQQPSNGNFSFPPNTVVYYKLDSTLSIIPLASSGDSPSKQIVAALDSWSAADKGTGGSGITFVPADAQHAPTLTVKADYSTGSAGASTSNADPSASTLGVNDPATVTFHPYAIIQGTTSAAYDKAQAGYDTAFLQTMLHEVGHLEGIGDYQPGHSPAPGQCTSVMKSQIGVNDSGDSAKKSGPTPCDVATAAQDAADIGNPPLIVTDDPRLDNPPVIQLTSPGDDGLGGSCDWNDYWDGSTSTLYSYCS